jgi:hypothetical protein
VPNVELGPSDTVRTGDRLTARIHFRSDLGADPFYLAQAAASAYAQATAQPGTILSKTRILGHRLNVPPGPVNPWIDLDLEVIADPIPALLLLTWISAAIAAALVVYGAVITAQSLSRVLEAATEGAERTARFAGTLAPLLLLAFAFVFLQRRAA